MSGTPVADSFFSRPPDTVPASPGRTTSRIGKGIGISWKHYRQALTRGTRAGRRADHPRDLILQWAVLIHPHTHAFSQKGPSCKKYSLFCQKHGMQICKPPNIRDENVLPWLGSFHQRIKNDRIKQKSKKRGASPLLTGFCLFSSLTFLTRFTILFTQ